MCLCQKRVKSSEICIYTHSKVSLNALIGSIFVAIQNILFSLVLIVMYLLTEDASADDLSNQVALSKRSFLRRSVQRLFKRKYSMMLKYSNPCSCNAISFLIIT